jgi:pimeloyl-ACP methyl ester carboxylesterase
MDTGWVRHGWIERGDLRLHHLALTSGQGPPVVLIHGVTGHAWLWPGVAERLPGRTVYALELRGHGDSGWSPDGDYTTATHAADAAAVVDRLGLPPVDLVGLSWGGLVGAHLAAEHPGAVRRLVVIDVPPSFDQAPDAVPERPADFASHAEVVAWERAANRFATDAAIDLVASGSVRPGAGGRLVRKHDTVFLARWPFRSENHWPVLGRIRCPVLVVRADQSPVLAADVAARMVEAMADARLVDVGPSGHLVPLDAPGPLGRVLSSFLA